MPQLERPGYLEPVVDPTFGSTITRITGDPGTRFGPTGRTWSEIARHHYSKTQAWNADQSLLHLTDLDEDGGFLDGSTYRPVDLADLEVGESRWHPTDPDLRVYVSGDEIGLWNVRSESTDTLVAFNDYSDLRFGPSEGNLSLDGDRLVVLADDEEGRQVAFAYDLEENRKFPDVGLNDVDVDWASISPLGSEIVVNGAFNDSDQTKVFTVDGKELQFWEKSSRPSHYDLTVDETGAQVAVGVAKGGQNDGRVIKRDLLDGAITVLTPGGYASHTSARNVGRPGWVYVTYDYVGDQWLPFRSEVVAVPLDGSLRVQRIAHLRSDVGRYESESHASPSPDGARVIWASNWGAEDGLPIQGYVADVRPLCD